MFLLLKKKIKSIFERQEHLGRTKNYKERLFSFGNDKREIIAKANILNEKLKSRKIIYEIKKEKKLSNNVDLFYYKKKTKRNKVKKG